MSVAVKVLEFIKECGSADTEIVLKTSRESAIEALVADVVKTIARMEKSPVGRSGSNGMVERGVQSVEGLIRSLLLVSEEEHQFRFGR